MRQMEMSRSILLFLPQKLVAMAMSLEQSDKVGQIHELLSFLLFGRNLVKIGPVDLEIR